MCPRRDPHGGVLCAVFLDSVGGWYASMALVWIGWTAARTAQWTARGRDGHAGWLAHGRSGDCQSHSRAGAACAEYDRDRNRYGGIARDGVARWSGC